MSATLTGTGVTVSRGRGADAVSVTLSFREIERWAKRMKGDEARLWRLSYARAATGLKRKFQEAVASGGGVFGVPKFRDFEDFTKRYRASTGRQGAMGGVLADRRRVVMFRRGRSQVIGWPDALGQTARAFQEGLGGSEAEALFTDAASRRRLHRRGVGDVPRSYVHNPRPVIEPYFVEFARKNLDEWARQVYFKGLAKLMAGGRDRAFEGAFG